MNTLDELRVRYGRLSDDDLRKLLAVDAESLTPEARQALAWEVQLRGLAQMPAGQFMPAQVTGQWRYPKARLGARFMAYLIDGVIGILVPILAAAIPLITSGGHLSPVNWILFISSFVWAIYYSFTKDAWDKGRSIGKRAMGLMVVNITTNKPCSTGESSLRALMLMVMNAVPFVGSLIEPIIVLVNDKGRRVGDMVAGTQVIDARLYDPDAEYLRESE